MRLLFSDSLLAGLVASGPQAKRYFVDLGRRGLVFELTPSGGYFHFRYTYCQRQKMLSIAKLGEIDVAAARAKAAEYAHLLLDDVDPAVTATPKFRTPTLQEFFEHRYLPHVRTYKSTDTNDLNYFKNHLLPAFGDRPLNAIRRGDLSLFVSRKLEEGLKPGSINRYIVAMRHALNLAVEWDVPGMHRNPLQKYKLLKENNLITRFLSEEQTQRLRKALCESQNPHLAPIVALLLVTGARKSEVLKARWEQFDLDRRQWRVPKSKSGYHRFIPISDVARQILEERRSTAPESPWVFPNPTTGKPFVEIFNSWKTARLRAGLKDLRIHDLRHSFASSLVNGGAPLYEVQKLLGHSSIRTTERYAHLAPERLLGAMRISDAAFGSMTERTSNQLELGLEDQACRVSDFSLK